MYVANIPYLGTPIVNKNGFPMSCLLITKALQQQSSHPFRVDVYVDLERPTKRTKCENTVTNPPKPQQATDLNSHQTPF